MNKNLENNYITLWEDICFYEVWHDKISFKNYITFLSNKYSTTTDDILRKIIYVRKMAAKSIKLHEENQQDYPPILHTASEEESIKFLIEYNRKREELQEKSFNKKSETIEKIKKLGLLKK